MHPHTPCTECACAECTEVRVKLRRRRCVHRVDMTCDKFDNRWYILKNGYRLETSLPAYWLPFNKPIMHLCTVFFAIAKLLVKVDLVSGIICYLSKYCDWVCCSTLILVNCVYVCCSSSEVYFYLCVDIIGVLHYKFVLMFLPLIRQTYGTVAFCVCLLYSLMSLIKLRECLIALCAFFNL